MQGSVFKFVFMYFLQFPR